MNARQRKFAHEYVKNGFVGVLAVYAAGYNQGYGAAAVTASRLLKKAKVQQMIEDDLNDAKLSAERVSQEIAKLSYAPVKEIDSTAKLKALDLASKVLGMQSTKLETVDLTLQSASESALLKSIQSAAKRDNIADSDAAIQLYQALSDDPQFSDLASWPAQYRPAIQAQLQATEQVTEISGEQ